MNWIYINNKINKYFKKKNKEKKSTAQAFWNVLVFGFNLTEISLQKRSFCTFGVAVGGSANRKSGKDKQEMWITYIIKFFI